MKSLRKSRLRLRKDDWFSTETLEEGNLKVYQARSSPSKEQKDTHPMGERSPSRLGKKKAKSGKKCSEGAVGKRAIQRRENTDEGERNFGK